ncbi:hypothetical protein ACHAXR_008765 [Thalassiosira sp. AJA248-18]
MHQQDSQLPILSMFCSIKRRFSRHNSQLASLQCSLHLGLLSCQQPILRRSQQQSQQPSQLASLQFSLHLGLLSSQQPSLRHSQQPGLQNNPLQTPRMNQRLPPRLRPASRQQK